MVQMLLVSRSSRRALSNSPSSSGPRYLWVDGLLRLACLHREAGWSHPPPRGQIATIKNSHSPENSILHQEILYHLLLGHDLTLPGVPCWPWSQGFCFLNLLKVV